MLKQTIKNGRIITNIVEVEKQRQISEVKYLENQDNRKRIR